MSPAWQEAAAYNPIGPLATEAVRCGAAAELSWMPTLMARR